VLSVPSSEPSSEVLPREQTLPLWRLTNRSKKKKYRSWTLLTTNYRPVVPVEVHSDELYAELSPEVWLKVKVEKTDRSEFRANLKAKKYVGKERVESTAFNSDEGNDGKEGKAWTGGFF